MALENVKRMNDEVPNATLVDVLLLGDPWMDYIIFKYFWLGVAFTFDILVHISTLNPCHGILTIWMSIRILSICLQL
jgi:hypothetical protein